MSLFGRKTSPDIDNYFPVCASENMPEEEMTAVKVDGRKIILIRYEGRVYAIDSLCPHAAADLTKGSLRSWQLCCHEHNYCFDIRSGLIVWPEDEVYRLRRYEVKEADGQIFIRLIPCK